MSLEKYKVHQCIGRGNFGDVYKGEDLYSGSLVAIKVVNLDESEEDISTLILEIQFLSKLRSPYITEYVETFIHDMSMWIIMEYCGGGSCSDLLKCFKKLNEDITAFIIRDVLKGLKYLHEESKVHRDIKLANILLTDKGDVKLADFGVSGEITFTKVKKNTFVGTPFWMAPEIISRQKNGYDAKADVWSTGITTIELVTGSPPLSQYDPMKVLFEIPKKRPPLLTGANFSENIKDFVKYCLIKDPKQRPNSASLLHHKFVRNVKKNVNLLKLIEEKRAWYAKNKKTKKPRYSLHPNNEENHNNRPVVKWEFSRRSILPHTSSPMEQTLLEKKDDGMSPCDGLNSLNKINSSQSHFPASLTKSLKSPISPGPMSTSTPVSPNSPEKQSGCMPVVSCKPSHPICQGHSSENLRLNINFLENVILYSLSRIRYRAKTDATKETINQLTQNFISYEADQPGLCEAFIEEILMLHIANPSRYS